MLVAASALSAAPGSLFHQFERRVKGHVVVALRGYALWVTLKHGLRQRATGFTPARAPAAPITVQTADIILPAIDGREIPFRRLATPGPDQQRLLHALGVTIPAHLEWNAECRAESATARPDGWSHCPADCAGILSPHPVARTSPR